MAIAAPPKFPGVQPRHHAPSGQPSWPRILISGEEGAHKSWTAAELSADSRIDGMFWLELGAGEVTAEEYGAIPDVKYQVIDHDGTYVDIYQQLCVHWHLAKEAEAEGRTIALALDSMSGEWEMLQSYGDLKARRREAKKLEDKRKDPTLAWSLDYEISISHDIWTFLRKKRHEPIMALIQSWPGPVVYTAKETLATPFDDSGNPIARADKVWSLQAHKSVPGASTTWVRLTRGGTPEIVKLRSVRHGIAVIPKSDADAAAAAPAGKADKRTTRPWKGERFTIASLIFDVIGCVPGESRAPEFNELDADQEMPGDNEPTISPEERAKARQRAASGAALMLNAATATEAQRLLAAARAPGLGDQDVTEHLTDDDAANLGIDVEQPVTLMLLAEKVVAYWAKHGTSPRAPIEPEAEGQAA
jgi:hypothetical protein